MTMKYVPGGRAENERYSATSALKRSPQAIGTPSNESGYDSNTDDVTSQDVRSRRICASNIVIVVSMVIVTSRVSVIVNFHMWSLPPPESPPSSASHGAAGT